MDNREMKQENEAGKRSQKRKRHRMKKKGRLRMVFTILLLILLVLAGGLALFYSFGKSRLKSKTLGMSPQLILEQAAEAEGNQSTEAAAAAEWDEDWIGYNGKVYQYNEDIMTFLIMGIDQSGEVKLQEEGTDGGQADAIFLAVLNPHTHSMKLIGINRDTMTDVDVYSYFGNYVNTTTQQIALQHSYGDGGAKSAEYMVKAVSNLMFQLPISGYCAINMDAVSEINDAVGGVTLTCLEDISISGSKYHKGISLKKDEEVHLEGDAAFWYVKWRDTKEFESARNRLARQKQYLSAFVDQAKAALKEDMTLPVTMLNQLSKYIITDLSANEITYLASEAVSYTFGSNDIYSLEGETKLGNLNEEFYPDKDALNELIIEVFYEEVIR